MDGPLRGCGPAEVRDNQAPAPDPSHSQVCAVGPPRNRISRARALSNAIAASYEPLSDGPCAATTLQGLPHAWPKAAEASPPAARINMVGMSRFIGFLSMS